MTIKFAVFFVVLILMSACNGDKKAPFTDVNTSTSAIPVANQPEKIVLNFYRWYLKNVYQKEMVESAEVKLTTDSLYQLDASKHLAFLKKVGYFSSSFYENERSVYKACDSALTKYY